MYGSSCFSSSRYNSNTRINMEESKSDKLFYHNSIFIVTDIRSTHHNLISLNCKKKMGIKLIIFKKHIHLKKVFIRIEEEILYRVLMEVDLKFWFSVFRSTKRKFFLHLYLSQMLVVLSYLILCLFSYFLSEN